MEKHPPVPLTLLTLRSGSPIRSGQAFKGEIRFHIPSSTYLKPLLLMLKRFFVSLFFIIGFVDCFSQIPVNFPSVNNYDLPGAKLSTFRTYNGTSLFGYIDGGADLYLEYGFSVVSVTEINYMNGKYKTEIYKMNGPEEAFGIFSVSKYRCLDMPGLSEFTCRTKYQLQICKGPYYISIINGTGTGPDSIASERIGEIITDKIKDKEIDLSPFLPGISSELIHTKCILVKGKLGIVNGSPDIEDFFRGINDYTAAIVNGDEKRIISVKFESRNSYLKFLELHNWKEEDMQNSGSPKKIAEYHLLIDLPY
jgi:hypothetical protein